MEDLYFILKLVLLLLTAGGIAFFKELKDYIGTAGTVILLGEVLNLLEK